jgi:YesN/AraC family two-component response regulator
MMTWPRFRTICLCGVLASFAVAVGFWYTGKKHAKHSQDYYSESVLPALAETKGALESREGKILDITPILSQHIENQSKISDASWNMSLSFSIGNLFILGLMIYRIREEVLKKRTKQAEDQKNEKPA